MRHIALAALLAALTCSLGTLAYANPPPGPEPAKGKQAPFDVAFADCREVANVGEMPTANARPLVPAQFTLLGDGTPNTPFVVRTVHCDSIAVGKDHGTPGDILQIGFLIVGPDRDGDINNYTAYYDTSHPQLAAALRKVGVPANHVPQLKESLVVENDGTGVYDFVVPAPFDPALTFTGTVGAPSASPIPFTANWWSTSSGVTVKMNSSFPQLFAADNDVNLTVPPNSPLAILLGTDSVTSWPVLKLFDHFPSAEMHVTLR